MSKYSYNERGMATLVALIMVGLLTLLGLAALKTSNDEVAIAGNELQEMRAFYSAEAGLELGLAKIEEQYTATGQPPTEMPSGTEKLNGSEMAYSVADAGAYVQSRLESGPFAGLHSMKKTYTVVSTAVNPSEQAKVQLSEAIEANMVPIFQFAIFYDDDLWATPQKKMTINGRVHCNGNMYLQAVEALYVNGSVTAAGGIYHGFPDGLYSGTNGDVYFKDAVGLYQNMLKSGEWLDADNKDWYTQASARWGGKVRDAAFEQPKLNLPLSDAAKPHKIIEPAAGGNDDSYENKATLKIINNVVYRKIGGVWSDVTSTLQSAGVITYAADKFYDAREKKYVDATEIDLGKLYSSGYAPSNGVLYFSDDIVGSGEFPGLRIKNATTLGAGLTVASANPVYTVGDFNTTNKQPAAILTDAYTILSSSWDDSKSAGSMNTRQAANTVINASFITGDAPCSSTNYNGGLANLPRYLEYWGSGKTSTICGSMVNLWNSTQSTGKWSLNYYEPPVRDWSFDTDLNDPSKQPPEVPKILIFERSGWSQQYIAWQTE